MEQARRVQQDKLDGLAPHYRVIPCMARLHLVVLKKARVTLDNHLVPAYDSTTIELYSPITGRKSLCCLEAKQRSWS